MRHYSMKNAGILVIVLFLSCAGSDTEPILNRTETIPKAQRKSHSIKAFSKTYSDEYFWMKDKSRCNEEVLSYIKEENRYTEAVVEPCKEKIEQLYEEMRARLTEDDLHVPEKIDDYYYYSKDLKGNEYPVYCRKKGSLESIEEVILDVNLLAADQGYLEVADISISPDHKMLAYLADTEGNEFYRLFIKDLSTGHLLNDNAYPVGDMEWGEDNKSIYFSLMDMESNRSDKVFVHVLGEEKNKLLFVEEDEGFNAGISKSRDKKYLFISSFSHTASEVFYAPSTGGEFKVFTARIPGHIYYPESRNGEFYIWTNCDGAKDFKVMKCQQEETSSSNWRSFIDGEDGIHKDFVIFKDHFVLSETKESDETLKVLNFSSGKWHEIPLGDPPYAVYLHNNPEFTSKIFRYSFVSMIDPYSVIDHDMNTKHDLVKKVQKIIGGYSRKKYHQERIYAQAEDGTKVPISLVYKRSLFKGDGSNPLWLYGYGAYGDSNTDYFSSARLTLLDRGWVYAIAHVRGGGELGKKWHEQGSMLNKKNTFTDFISCAESLYENKYSSADKAVINGVSAGGMLIGAVLNIRPEIARMAILEVPFVDVLNAMMDPTLSAVVSEYEEWGNPNIREEFNYIASYCPYTNLKQGKYPDILITAGMNDMRVNYWEGLKYTAKLRQVKTGDSLVLLKMNMSGHFGDSGRYEYYKDLAFIYGYAISTIR